MKTAEAVTASRARYRTQSQPATVSHTSGMPESLVPADYAFDHGV